MTSLDDLRTRVTGRVLVPTDPGFTEAVTGFNLSATYAPDAAVIVATDADVVEAVAYALANDLAVSVQATGHGSVGHLEGGLLIITTALNEVSITGDIATIGAGADWTAVVEAAGPLGLTAIAGAAPGVGVVGFLLGGGLGPLARSHGFSSDRVRSFRIVTGTGELVTASATEHPDLFWALRGGKAGFGVVTSVDVELVELTEIYGGSMFFATEHIADAMRGWIDWTATADPQVSTSIAILRFPPFDEIPEPMRGKTLLNLRFAYPGSNEDGERLAAPLRALAPVMMDMVGAMPTTKMGMIHNDPTAPSPAWADGAMFAGVDDALADAVLANVGGDQQSPFIAVEIRHLGNRTAVDVEGGSAVGGRDAAFTLNTVAIPTPHTPVPAIESAWEKLIGDLAEWKAPVTTINFAGEPSAADFAKSWPRDMFERLQEVAKVYDPEGRFTWNRPAR
ncbi:MAG: FAD-binding protein [Microbacteriaceae bacterium]|nr:FAD-binding protein [Microbacteriaceae bacterium]